MSTTSHRATVSFLTAVTLIFSVALSPSLASASTTSTFGVLREPGDPAFIAAHRGDRSVAPENTLPALRAAIEGSLDYVETDVQLSRDGVPVLFHDRTLKRTAGAEGRISSYSLAELRRLDVGSWFSPQFVDTRIPTLAEFLAILAPSSKKAMIELKDEWTAEQLEPVISLLRRHALTDRVILPSFSVESLAALRASAPDIAGALLTATLPEDVITVARELAVVAVITTPEAIADAPDSVARLHRSALGVLVYTLNEETHWSQMRAYGVDGIITDLPSELDGWLARTAPGT
jgi:glycerophosphoryl diester phosphodiesterase